MMRGQGTPGRKTDVSIVVDRQGDRGPSYRIQCMGTIRGPRPCSQSPTADPRDQGPVPRPRPLPLQHPQPSPWGRPERAGAGCSDRDVPLAASRPEPEPKALDPHSGREAGPWWEAPWRDYLLPPGQPGGSGCAGDCPGDGGQGCGSVLGPTMKRSDLGSRTPSPPGLPPPRGRSHHPMKRKSHLRRRSVE